MGESRFVSKREKEFVDLSSRESILVGEAEGKRVADASRFRLKYSRSKGRELAAPFHLCDPHDSN